MEIDISSRELFSSSNYNTIYFYNGKSLEYSVGITRFRKNIVHKLLNLHLNSTAWRKRNKYLKSIWIRWIRISHE